MKEKFKEILPMILLIGSGLLAVVGFVLMLR